MWLLVPQGCVHAGTTWVGRCPLDVGSLLVRAWFPSLSSASTNALTTKLSAFALRLSHSRCVALRRLQTSFSSVLRQLSRVCLNQHCGSWVCTAVYFVSKLPGLFHISLQQPRLFHTTPPNSNVHLETNKEKSLSWVARCVILLCSWIFTYNLNRFQD